MLANHRKYWNPISYLDDDRVFLRCSCGFEYPCEFSGDDNYPSENNQPVNILLVCPECGAKKKYFYEGVEKTENYRNLKIIPFKRKNF